MRNWLIIADDLTGAGDCGIAFARRGMPTNVAWGGMAGAEGALAINANSRGMTAEEAAACHCDLLQAVLGRPGTRLYKKIDSTLRGQPAAELAATLGALRARKMGSLAIVAPAFSGGRAHDGEWLRARGRRGAGDDDALGARSQLCQCRFAHDAGGCGIAGRVGVAIGVAARPCR
jgi:hypothetical protein